MTREQAEDRVAKANRRDERALVRKVRERAPKKPRICYDCGAPVPESDGGATDYQCDECGTRARAEI